MPLFLGSKRIVFINARNEGGGAARFASRPAPTGYRWDFVTFRSERITQNNEPIVALVRVA